MAKYRGRLLETLAGHYHKHSLVKQLHVGPIRNNSTRNFRAIGPDAGFDSPDDFSYARRLSAFLDSADSASALPKTILYCLNPKDNLMLAAMAGNFQTSEAKGKRSVRGSISRSTWSVGAPARASASKVGRVSP